ncbi:MAG: UTP--glucose-1-phosphate uridylyltransferase, partial [Firmicutes bacterium]|nr:UTP--glucose-1-phosphate uridylyltransferase [Bacillota bacterium]
KNGELSVTDAYNLMIEKELLMAQDINGRRYDMGNKLGFVIANIDACFKDPTYGEDLRKYLKSLDL